MKLLIGHTSEDTAYVVDDYPYGFRLRCKIRYWLEHHPKRGVRFVSQTTNPKRGDVWNKSKASTYCMFGGAMYLDDNNHVQWSGLTEYSDTKQSVHFLETFGEAVPEAAKVMLKKWIAARIAYDLRRPQSQ